MAARTDYSGVQDLERGVPVLGEQQEPGPAEGVRQEVLQEVLPLLRASIHGGQVRERTPSSGFYQDPHAVIRIFKTDPHTDEGMTLLL